MPSTVSAKEADSRPGGWPPSPAAAAPSSSWPAIEPSPRRPGPFGPQCYYYYYYYYQC